MRLAVRLFRAPNQNVTNPKLWQDPVLGYFETHGKTEFLAGEEYNLTDDEKKAVLWRYKIKEILKKEEFDPSTFKYKEGVVMDPAMFRWYAANMTQAEYFRMTPRSVFLYVGGTVFAFYFLLRLIIMVSDKRKEMSLNGELLWWDRQDGRTFFTGGSGHSAPSQSFDF